MGVRDTISTLTRDGRSGRNCAIKDSVLDRIINGLALA